MKSTIFGLIVALAAQEVSAHATFQDLWINSVDKIGSLSLFEQKMKADIVYTGTCVRLPPSNSPVTDVTSMNISCNVGSASGVSGKCSVNAGGTVTIEMHQV